MSEPLTHQVITEVEGDHLVIRVRDRTLPNVKQREFYATCEDPEAEEIMFDGSIRMGKTQACCRKIVQWAWRYGGRYAVARKTYPELINSTMKVMLTGEGAMPPALPEALVREYLKGERTVFLKNGAEIFFTNLESVEEGRAKLRNISLNGMFIDQVEELDSEDWAEFYEELMGRLSDPRGPGKMLLAANPGPTDHWAYKRFIDEEYRSLYTQTRYVHGTLYDNRENLDERYFQSRIRTREQNPEYYKRMVLGEWGSFGGKRFKMWDRSVHVVDPFTIPEWWEVIEAVDYGYAHPFVCLWIAIDEHERYHVIGEHYETERPISYHARRIKEIREALRVNPVVMWADPSIFAEGRNRDRESIAMEMFDQGLYPAKADNDRLGGWNRIEEMLSEEVEGQRRLVVTTHCPRLIKELPNLRFRENSDDVEKKNDHAADALRYAVMSRPPAATPPKEDDPEGVDRRTLYLRRKMQEAEHGSYDRFDLDVMGV